jgi:UDP-N-acetylglucosamine 4,6-dehydratase
LSSLDVMRGGEIFVPKIPSMKITDLANCLAPDLPTEIVGIRPGEKLHEIMVTDDDARTTLDCGDRYIIQPAFKEWNADKSAYQGATSVPEGFRYASDTNTEWLDANGLSTIIEKG